VRTLMLVLLVIMILAVSAGCAAQSTATSSDNSTPTSTTTSDTTPPTGTPPSGTPPTGAAPGGSPSGTSTATSISGAFALSSGTKSTTAQSYTATKADQSAIYVTGTGVLTLTSPTVTTSGDTSSQGNSSFYGQNAGVLAGGGTIHMTGGTITTTGAGANGAFATGTGSKVTLSQTTIDAKGDGGHAAMVTQGGTMTLSNVNMTTAGIHSGSIATDRGGGTITATGGTVVTSGQDSPAVYSTGVITVSGATLTATGSEAAVIEGANSITLNNCITTSGFGDKWGVLIYQSFSGDAEGARGVFTVTGGSLKYAALPGPLFYVTNTTAVITLKGADVSVAFGILINAAGGTRWGTSGSNGGTVEFAADAQTLAGSVVTDKISTVALTLKNGSSLAGAINTAKSVSPTLDASSTWTVTADSHVTSLSDTAGISGTKITNIVGNGHTVTYDSSANPGLGGKTYTLSGGGVFKPAS
jgi:hypothetical protein